MWEVTIQGDANSPYIFEDASVLQQFLSSQSTTVVIMVVQYDKIQRGTIVYGLVGDPPLPTPPSPTIATKQTTKIYIERV